MPQYDAILFDFDGVLLDSEPIHFECWNQVLNRFGVGIGWDRYSRDCIGISDREMIEALCQGAGPEIVEAVWAEYPAKKEAFRARISVAPPFSDETVELIRSLGGYKLAVVSSSGRSEVEPPLVQIGLRPCFDAVICREDVERLKPAPDPYWKAAELLGAKNPLVVEDSRAGLESAAAAGFDALHIPHPSEMPSLLRDRVGRDC